MNDDKKTGTTERLTGGVYHYQSLDEAILVAYDEAVNK